MAKNDENRLIIRPWPKMIFLWPTCLLSLFMGLATQFAPAQAPLWGGVFVIVLALNLVVLTFEFPRATSLLVTFGVIIVIMAMVLINFLVFPIIKPLNVFLRSLDVEASPQFFYVLFFVQLCLFIGMWVVTRFDYWVLTPNEIIRHHGMLGDVERFSTAGLKLNKEIQDIFEYVLCGAGRVVMNVPGNPRPIILDNVLNISKIEQRSDKILNARVVRLEKDSPEEDRTAFHEGEAG